VKRVTRIRPLSTIEKLSLNDRCMSKNSKAAVQLAIKMPRLSAEEIGFTPKGYHKRESPAHVSGGAEF
jgi:hypothetical protein